MSLPQTLDAGDGKQIPLLNALQAARHIISATSLILEHPQISEDVLEIAQLNLIDALGGPHWGEIAHQLIDRVTKTDASING